jgi:hypothetical protein
MSGQARRCQAAVAIEPRLVHFVANTSDIQAARVAGIGHCLPMASAIGTVQAQPLGLQCSQIKSVGK